MVLYILNILKEYSDEEHRLSQEEIRDLLEKEYDMLVDRKSIKRNLENLRAEGYEINSTTLVRGSGKKQNEINTDYYIESDFDDSELRFLIDGLIFSKYVPSTQCEDLVNKLKGLTSKYFNPRIEFIQSLKDDKKMNKEIFYTIGVLDDAIREKKKVKFNYCAYDIDKKLKPKKDKETGKNKEHIVNPYYIIAAQGRYYLLCKLIVPIDITKPYYYFNGKFFKGTTEIQLQELIETNPEISQIEISYEHYFQICHLRQCYIDICQKIFNQQASIRCDITNNIDKELIYKRDLIWSAINVIKYLVEQEQFAEAERLLEKISGCNGLCYHDESKGCGCCCGKI